MDNEPSISVVMSVYNGEKYLSESIESILNQTFRDFEFIIIDDGSTDNSLKIIEDYQQKDNRVVLIRNKENTGLPASLNKGIKIAQGKYIARQDADDVSMPNRFEVQYKYMENNRAIDILGTGRLFIDIEGTIFSKNKIDSFNAGKILRSGENVFPHGTAFIQKKVFIEVGLYDERFLYTQDLEYWIRCYLRKKNIHRLKDCLYKYRITKLLRNRNGKFRVKRQLNALLQKAFLEGLDYGLYVINTDAIKLIIDYEKDADLFDQKESKNDTSNYWFFIARQALRSGKEKRYVRKCLYKSLCTNKHFYHCMMKIIFLILTYFNYDYKWINTFKFRRIWQ